MKKCRRQPSELEAAFATICFVAFIVFCVLILSNIIGCTTIPSHEFNSDDLQDGMCYNAFGGMHGYCDR